MVSTASLADKTSITSSGMRVSSRTSCSAAVGANRSQVFRTVSQRFCRVNGSFLSPFSNFFRSSSSLVRESRRSVLDWMTSMSFSASGAYSFSRIILSSGILMRVRGVRISWVMFAKKAFLDSKTSCRLRCSSFSIWSCRFSFRQRRTKNSHRRPVPITRAARRIIPAVLFQKGGVTMISKVFRERGLSLPSTPTVKVCLPYPMLAYWMKL